MESLELLASALAGRYRIERELGRGGMATVYLARDLKQDRQVALKLLSPELSHLHGTERFLQEIALTARLQHPNILPLFDSGEAGGQLWYVMPYVEGESLKARLEREGALPAAEAGRLAREVADALACAHRAGIIHRDVKPANILLSGGHALLADFGIAHVVTSPAGSTLTATGALVGTPSYMSPEQALGERELTASSDVYALGCVLHEMLTGRPLVSGATPFAVLAQKLEEAAPVTGVPEKLAAVVRRAVSRDPAQRYQTAEQLGEAIDDALALESEAGRAVQKSARRHRLLALAAVATVIVVAGVGFITVRAKGQREEALRQLQEAQGLAAAGNYRVAFARAQALLELLPDDTVLAQVWGEVSRPAVVHTVPAGAKVYVSEWIDGERPGWAAEWQYLGITPLDSVRVPRMVTHRARIEKEGYRPVEVVSHHGGVSLNDIFIFANTRVDGELVVRLDPVDSLPDGMVRVAGFPPPPNTTYRDFFIDRLEVSNRDYQVFVDSGGYTRPEYWRHPFVRDGRTLSREGAMAQLLDRTGRLGPSTWSLGRYPEGGADLPVGGISWYEAAAYAAFVGKLLPTVSHWNQAARLPLNSFSESITNLAGPGPMPVGRSGAVSTFGAYDMVGNVREWLYNEDRGLRWILGGSWSDQDLPGHGALPPFDRSPENGVRLARYFDHPDTLAIARAPMSTAGVRDYSKERPVGNAEFSAILRLYQYQREPLDARVEGIDTARYWIRERVTFAPAYAGERMLLYLYLPRTGKPPYQSVVYIPGAYALTNQNRPDEWRGEFEFLLRQGRAVALPAIRGTYDRDTALDIGFRGTRGYDRPSDFMRGLVIDWSRDVQRSVDYLVSRPDMDSDRVGYYGYSWGGTLAPIMLATEPRFKAAVLYVAGLRAEPAEPEADEFNFLPRVTLPVLLIDGRYDPIFDLDTQQKPFFDLLGTAAAHRRHLVFEVGHLVPAEIVWRETLSWFDRYLGEPGR